MMAMMRVIAQTPIVAVGGHLLRKQQHHNHGDEAKERPSLDPAGFGVDVKADHLCTAKAQAD